MSKAIENIESSELFANLLNNKLAILPRLTRASWVNTGNDVHMCKHVDYIIGKREKENVKLYDMYTGKCVLTLAQDDYYVSGECIFALDAYTLLIVSTTGVFETYDLRSKMRIIRIETHRHFDHKKIAHDGMGKVYFISGTNNEKDDYTVECVNLHTKQVSTIYRGDDQRIISIDLLQGKDEIMIGIKNKRLVVLDAKTGQQKKEAYLINLQLNDHWNTRLMPSDIDTAAWYGYADDIAIHDIYSGSLKCLRDLKDTFADMDARLRERYKNYKNYYKIWDVFFSEDSQYMVTVYSLQQGEKAFADIWAIAQNTVLTKQSTDESLVLSHTLISQLERYAFSHSTITDIVRTYKRAAVDTVNVMTTTMHWQGFTTAFCPKTGNIVFEVWKDNEVRTLDIEQLEFTWSVYSDTHVSTLSVYEDKTLLAWDKTEVFDRGKKIESLRYSGTPCRYAFAIKQGASYSDAPYACTADYTVLSKEGASQYEGVSAASDINDKYLFTLSQDQQQIEVLDRKTDEVLRIPLNECKCCGIIATSHNDIFFMVDEDMSIWRYVLHGEGNYSRTKLPFVYVQNYRHHFFQSKDGNYIVFQADNRLTAYNAKTGEVLCKKEWQIPHHFGKDFFLKGIDIKMRFIMLCVNDENVKYVFLDPKTFDAKAILHIFTKRRFLWETLPDEGAPQGWFYTNVPEMVNVYTQTADGETKLLSPKDVRRQQYIQTYNRKDMVKKRLLDPQSYKRSITQLSEVRVMKDQMTSITRFLPGGSA